MEVIGALLAAALFALPAHAEVTTAVEHDEIAGSKTYTVRIQADNFVPVEREEYLAFRCSPKGQLGFGWHQGGEASGDYWIEGVTFKIDDHAPISFDVRQTSDFRPILAQLAGGTTLIARTEPAIGGTVRFSLKGLAEAITPFRGQCLPASR